MRSKKSKKAFKDTATLVDNLSITKMKTEEYKKLVKEIRRGNTEFVPRIESTYNTEFPPILDSTTGKKKIQVAVSSTETSEETLLHYLLKKIKR